MKGPKRQGLRDAIALFHSGDYIEFQEALEALHHGADEIGRFFYEALIQLATALRLVNEFESKAGAERMLRQALIKLESIPPTYQRVNVKALMRDTESLLTRLKDRSVNPMAERTIPKIRLKFWG